MSKEFEFTRQVIAFEKSSSTNIETETLINNKPKAQKPLHEHVAEMKELRREMLEERRKSKGPKGLDEDEMAFLREVEAKKREKELLEKQDDEIKLEKFQQSIQQKPISNTIVTKAPTTHISSIKPLGLRITSKQQQQQPPLKKQKTNEEIALALPYASSSSDDEDTSTSEEDN